MARLDQRAALRAAGHAARRGARALSGAALVLTLAAARGLAQAPDGGAGALAGSGLPDAASWWGRPGQAGWLPEACVGQSFPATYAGLLHGAWRLDEPARPAASLPWPGVAQARTPLGWYDSLSCGEGGGAESGQDAALAALTARSPAGVGRARSTFTMANGAHGLDEYSVTLARSDSLQGFGVDAMSGTRGYDGGVAETGRHSWGGRLHVARGAHRLDASFAQRGADAVLVGGERQSVRGLGGGGGWRWRRAGIWCAAGVARGLTWHESQGGTLEYSERRAQETRWTGGIGLARGGRELSSGVTWTEAETKRLQTGSFSRQARSVWGVTRGTSPLVGGRLNLAVGMGWMGGVERFDVAPSAAFTRSLRGVEASARVERLLAPVWADLAPGLEPFLQHAWVGTVGAAARPGGSWRAQAKLRGGRVYSRALVRRLPFEEFWLRQGISAEYGTYDFVLAEGMLEHVGRRVDAGVEGFGLGHRSTVAPEGIRSAAQADPNGGFRAWLGGRGRLFKGDLGVSLRGEVAGVGARQLDDGSLPRLPAFLTFSAVGEAVLGEAVIVVRARNLEDRPRESAWADPATGTAAIVGRREVTLSLVWRLFN